MKGLNSKSSIDGGHAPLCCSKIFFRAPNRRNQHHSPFIIIDHPTVNRGRTNGTIIAEKSSAYRYPCIFKA